MGLQHTRIERVHRRLDGGLFTPQDLWCNITGQVQYRVAFVIRTPPLRLRAHVALLFPYKYTIQFFRG